jgi:hypothetical protein
MPDPFDGLIAEPDPARRAADELRRRADVAELFDAAARVVSGPGYCRREVHGALADDLAVFVGETQVVGTDGAAPGAVAVVALTDLEAAALVRLREDLEAVLPLCHGWPATCPRCS